MSSSEWIVEKKQCIVSINHQRRRRPKRVGDPACLPVKRNHKILAFVDTTHFYPTCKPTSEPTTRAKGWKVIINGPYGHYHLPLNVQSDASGWPTRVQLDFSQLHDEKERKYSDKIVRDFFFELKHGLLASRPYRFHINGRIFEEGVVRGGMLRLKRYDLRNIDPRYLVGFTKRYEAFIDSCYDFANPLFRTYQLSVVVPPLAPLNDGGSVESVYHGVQHLWYYKQADARSLREWTLGFQNLQIDKFCVPPERRGREFYPPRRPLVELPLECVGRGSIARYHQSRVSYNYHRHREGWNVVEVARYFWYGREMTRAEFLALCWSHRHTGALADDPIGCKAIEQYVTHIKEIGLLILVYANDFCFHSALPDDIVQKPID